MACQQDECALIWYSGKEEKKLWLSTVSRIVPGQRTVSPYLIPILLVNSCDGRLYMYHLSQWMVSSIGIASCLYLSCLLVWTEFSCGVY